MGVVYRVETFLAVESLLEVEEHLINRLTKIGLHVTRKPSGLSVHDWALSTPFGLMSAKKQACFVRGYSQVDVDGITGSFKRLSWSSSGNNSRFSLTIRK